MLKSWMLLGFLLIISVSASADSITIGLSSGSTTLTPGIDQLLVTKYNSIGFDAFAGPGPYTVSWLLTFTIPGQSPQIVTDSFTCPAGQTACGLVFSFNVPTTFTPLPFTFVEQAQFGNGLTLSKTFNEHFITQVPEPVSLLLVATGLAGIGWRRFQGGRLKKRTPAYFDVSN